MGWGLQSAGIILQSTVLHRYKLEFCSPQNLNDKLEFSDEVMLNVLGCRLTYYGQTETNAEAWFNKSLRPRKPEGSLGQTAQDGHLDSHTAPEL